TFLELSAGVGAAAAVGWSAPARAASRRPDVIVEPGASVQAVVDAAPSGASTPYVIGFRPGRHLGQVIVPADKTFLEFRGLGRAPGDVVIADDRANGTLKPDGTPWGTSGSASVTLSGADFRATNLTLANLFDEAAHPEIANR